MNDFFRFGSSLQEVLVPNGLTLDLFEIQAETGVRFDGIGYLVVRGDHKLIGHEVGFPFDLTFVWLASIDKKEKKENCFTNLQKVQNKSFNYCRHLTELHATKDCLLSENLTLFE